MRKCESFMSKDGKLADGASLLAYCDSLGDYTSESGQEQLLKVLKGMSLRLDAVQDEALAHITGFAETYFKITDHKSKSYTDMWRAMLQTLPVKPVEGHVPRMRGWLAEKVNDGQHDWVTVFDAEKVIERLRRYLNDLGMAEERGGMMPLPDKSNAKSEEGKGGPPSGRWPKPSDNDCDLCDSFLCSGKLNSVLKGKGPNFCCVFNKNIDLTKLANYHEGSRAVSYVMGGRRYLSKNPELQSLKGKMFRNKKGALVPAVSQEAVVYDDPLDAYMAEREGADAESGTGLAMPIVGTRRDVLEGEEEDEASDERASDSAVAEITALRAKVAALEAANEARPPRAAPPTSAMLARPTTRPFSISEGGRPSGGRDRTGSGQPQRGGGAG